MKIGSFSVSGMGTLGWLGVLAMLILGGIYFFGFPYKASWSRVQSATATVDDAAPKAPRQTTGTTLHYFFFPSCGFCQKYKEKLEAFEEQYSEEIEVFRHDVSSDEGKMEVHKLSEKFGIRVNAVPSCLWIDASGHKLGREGAIVNGRNIPAPPQIMIH